MGVKDTYEFNCLHVEDEVFKQLNRPLTIADLATVLCCAISVREAWQAEQKRLLLTGFDGKVFQSYQSHTDEMLRTIARLPADTFPDDKRVATILRVLGTTTPDAAAEILRVVVKRLTVHLNGKLSN